LTPLLRKLVGSGSDQADRPGILLVDHDMTLVFDTCDYVYVLHNGSILAHGVPQSVRGNPAVIEAYLGSEDDGGQGFLDEGERLPTFGVRGGSGVLEGSDER
jgi:ABC-type transporter Mla maintaining outer membrane lipid asymmetry ATPase subunit MlaF